MRTNAKRVGAAPTYTHGGAQATRANAEQELRRSVLATMLWEDQFYEDGEAIADRIKRLVGEVRPEVVARLARQARTDMHLRHVPLLLLRELARLGRLSENDLYDTIQRADEIAEFLSIYWKDGKQPISAQVKRGLAAAFNKFDEYAFSKYNQDREIKLRDVLFLVHPKAKNKDQQKLFDKIVNGTLAVPDTWEVELSGSKDKRLSWTRLLREGHLGGLALIRNLRNMEQAGVDPADIYNAFKAADFSRVLPFRFIAAARHAPRFERQLDVCFVRSFKDQPKLSGKTIVIVDVSGSMGGGISKKSDMNRLDSAAALTAIIRELSEEVVVYATAGNDYARVHTTTLVPARHGMALVEAINKARAENGGGGIFTRQVIDWVRARETSADRIIVITDEQDCAGANDPPSKAIPFGTHNYLINVGSYKNGVSYTPQWNRIDGFSEATVKYITMFESLLGQS